MSWGERSCKKPCRVPDSCTELTCNVRCPGYEHDGVTTPDTSPENVARIGYMQVEGFQDHPPPKLDLYVAPEASEIEKADTAPALTVDEFVAAVVRLARPHCARCHGRGYQRVLRQTKDLKGIIVPCGCAARHPEYAALAARARGGGA